MYGLYSNSNSSSITFNPTTSKYDVKMGGKTIETTVTDRGAVADQWVRDILLIYANETKVVVGLDVEWKPNTLGTDNKSATLQLCIHQKCLILQLFYMDYIPQSLKSFLDNTKFTFVGVKVGDDIAKLRREYGLGGSGNWEDICELAKCKWPGRFSKLGLKNLAYEVCGISMEKPKHVSRSNWQARVLSESQVEYACNDAYASFKIGHKLIIEN